MSYAKLSWVLSVFGRWKIIWDNMKICLIWKSGESRWNPSRSLTSVNAGWYHCLILTPLHAVILNLPIEIVQLYYNYPLLSSIKLLEILFIYIKFTRKVNARMLANVNYSNQGPSLSTGSFLKPQTHLFKRWKRHYYSL